MIDWCYPVLVWALILGAIARGVQSLVRDSGPRWCPLLIGATVCLPVRGLPLARWLHGYNANFSIPLVAILLHAVLSPLMSRPLLDERALRTSGWFGCVSGLLLYPLSLGVGAFDPYSLGWQWPGVAGVCAALSALLVWRENAFGVVLLVSGLAWQIGCLESDNTWDYLVDPVYFFVSGIGLVMLARKRLPGTAGPPSAKE